MRVRERNLAVGTIVGFVLSAVAGITLLAGGSPAVAAVAAGPSVSISPTSGLAGTTVTFTGSGFSGCDPVDFRFDSTSGPLIAQTTPNSDGFIDTSGSIPTTASVDTTHPIPVLCNGEQVTVTRFTVTGPAPTTTTSTTKPTTTTSTTRPATTTTKPKGTTTTTRATTTTASTTTTTLPGETTTTTIPTETTTLPGETTTTNPGGADITLDHPAITPGGDVTASGQGCTAGAPVTLTADGHEAGATTADGRGRFTSPLDVRSLTPGRIQVVAVCGPTLTTDLDIVLASQVDTGTSTMIVLVFFVLIGAVVIRRQVRW